MNMNNSDNNYETTDFLTELTQSFFPQVSNEYQDNLDMWDDEDERALTAPARPLTDIEEFRRSNEFQDLE